MTVEEKVIDAFQLCDAVIKQAEQMQLEKQASDRAVSEQIPGVVDVLVSRGLIGPDERDDACSALRDPATTLTLLKRAAAYVTEAQDPKFGEQVGPDGRPSGNVKKASYAMGSESSPYVGARTTQQKPSDLALMRGLGLA